MFISRRLLTNFLSLMNPNVNTFEVASFEDTVKRNLIQVVFM